jgi:hypothetical protein
MSLSNFKLGPFFGINNRLPDSALHVATRYDTGDFVRDAVNVDVDNAGRFTHRLVPEVIAPMSGAHSLFMMFGNDAYFVRDSAIYFANLLPEYAETPIVTLSSDDPVSWWLSPIGDLYYSNGTDIGRLQGTTVFPAALPPPAPPAVVPIGGTLFRGTYQAALAYFDEVSGEEGALSPATSLALPESSGVRVTLPPAVPGATHVRVYLTGANGEALFLAAQVELSESFVDLHERATGPAAKRRFEVCLPPGRLFASNGRLCSISGSTLYLGVPYRPGYIDAAGGWMSFPTPVSVALDAQGGLYVASDKTYWIPHGEGAIRDVLPYGAVKGTEFSLPGEAIVGWFGKEGFVLAGPDGKVEAPMAENVELAPPAEGFSMVIDEEFTRVVACGWCMNVEGDRKAVTRYEGWRLTSWSCGYGTTDEGIVRLRRGNGPWFVDFGKLDLGRSNEKHLPAVYVGVESEGRLILSVRAAGFYETFSYFARRDSKALDVQRFDVGQGLRSNWFRLILSAEDGADFRLASLALLGAATRRKI